MLLLQSACADDAVFADELGMNTGPTTVEDETDATVFAQGKRPAGIDSDLIIPFANMNIEQFQQHLGRVYGRVIDQLAEDDEKNDIPQTLLTPSELEMYWELAFNPSGLPIFEEERVLLADGLHRFIKREGLRDPHLTLFPGYITRGNVLHFMFDLNQELHQLRLRINRDKEAMDEL